MKKKRSSFLFKIVTPILLILVLLSPLSKSFSISADEDVEVIEDVQTPLCATGYADSEYVVAVLFVAFVAVGATGVILFKQKN